MIRDTSLIAWDEIREKIGERQAEIMVALRKLTELHGNATDYEITIFLGKKDPNYVRPRRYELVNKLKLVGYHERRKCRVTGKQALAWKALR